MCKAGEPTVFVIDADPEARCALSQLLTAAGLRSEFYRSAEDFLESCDLDQPGCLIMDVELPGISGLDLQKHLHEEAIDLPIIFVTGHGSIALASRGFRMGAVDFMERPYDSWNLLDRIRAAIQLDAANRIEKAELNRIAARIDALSPPERQVLQLLIEGLPNKAIAAQLGVAQRTVEDRRARIMQKMAIRSVAELVWLVASRPALNSHLRSRSTDP